MTILTDTHKRERLPVDRGWAWLIMLAAYINLMLAMCFGRALSILLPSILIRYQEPATVTTLAFGFCDITWSITNIAIPTVLLPRFSVRSLALVGAVGHCLGVIALAYSPNIIMFNCIFGVLGASGGLMIVPSFIHVGHFFKKRLSFANSFSYAGGSTASVFVPLLFQFLLDIYGYQGTLLLLAGASFNCVAACMLLRPLSMYAPVEDVKTQNGHISKDVEFSDLNNVQARTLTYDDDDDREINEQSKFLENNDHENKQLREVSLTPDLKTTGSCHVTNSNIQHERIDGAEETSKRIPKFESELIQSTSNKSVDNELTEMSLFLPNSALDITGSPQRSIDILNNINSATFSRDCTVSNPDICFQNKSTENGHICSTTGDCVHCSNNSNSQQLKFTPTNYPELFFNEESNSEKKERIFNHTDPISDKESNLQESDANIPPSRCCSVRKMRESIRSSVLLNPLAVMLILAGGLSTPGGYMYLPVLGLENGLTSEEIPWMLTIIGVADVVGKLAIGYFADLGYFRPIHIACMTQFTVGTMCQFTMFYKGFGAMAAMATVFGLTAGICQALLTPMIIEMVGLQYLGQVTPIYFLVTGMSTFILNISVGAIRDSTGSFIGGFNFLGGMFLLSLVTLLLEPVFVWCRDRNSSNSEKSAKESARTRSSSV